MIGPPCLDGGLDLLPVPVAGDGFLRKGGDFVVGGEAEADKLAFGEFGDLVRGELVAQTKTLFEADDAVLHFEGVKAHFKGQQEESHGHRDGDNGGVGRIGPRVFHGENHVDEQDGGEQEMKPGIPLDVTLEALGGHRASIASAL